MITIACIKYYQYDTSRLQLKNLIHYLISLIYAYLRYVIITRMIPRIIRLVENCVKNIIIIKVYKKKTFSP